MVNEAPQHDWIRELGARVQGSVLATAAALKPYESDFGGLIRRAAAAVLKPARTEDIVVALELAARYRLPVAVRGAGHSQSGQTLAAGGLVLDMTSLSGIGVVDAQDARLTLEAGATWASAASAARSFGSTPAVLTSEHATSIGGTLGVGGVGSTSWKYGAQVDNVAWLDVVTGSGARVRCSDTQEADLFDAVRAGLGQCAVVVGANLTLRSIGSRVRIHTFVYETAAAFLRDLELLMQEQRSTHLLAHFRESREAPGRWQIHLTAGIEYDPPAEPDTTALGRGLGFARSGPTSDAALFGENHIFYFRYADWFGPLSDFVFPWVDHFVSWEAAESLLDSMLAGRSAMLLRLGVQTLIPIASPMRSAPLLSPARRPGKPVLLVGLFPKVPAVLAGIASDLIDSYADDVEQNWGGIRYLYGFRGPRTPEHWAARFGDRWQWLRAMKAKHDPHGLLGGSCVTWT